jgi:UDP-N-acetylmuramoyl-tripeptide--D-alanyl-D-alanine ligase
MLNSFKSILGIFWLVRTVKNTFFCLYLWQLKEYHLSRFISHFDTEKGKRLLLNPLNFLKVIFLFFIFFIQVLFLSQILLMIYIIESFHAFKNIFQKKLKLPILTKKIIFLALVSIILEISYFISIFSLPVPLFAFYLLVFDILTLVIISGIVLFFQPLAALARLLIIKRAIRKRAAFKDLIVVGITGSYGKTSTKEFLSTILSERFKVLKTKEHQNSEVGVSQCILKELRSEHRFFVVEMGAYNKGGIRLLCNIAKPKIGILTGINEQHMATFGSEENIIQGKYELIESLPKDGLAIFNGDNNYCFELHENTEISKRLSISNVPAREKIVKADAWAENIRVGKDYLSFKVFTKDGEEADFKVNLLGAQNVENILMAVIAAKELGMNLNEISDACKKIKKEQGGMRLIKSNKGFNIIDSTYSSNPNGVIANLEYLKAWQGNPEGKPPYTIASGELRGKSASYGARKIIIMPCLIELGKSAAEVHKRIGEKIGQICDLAIITTKDYFKELKDGSASSPQGGAEVLFIEDSKKIFEKIKDFNSPEDVILLQSRVPRELIDLLTKPH